MLTNNYKEKNTSKEGIVYALILVAYFSTIIVVFVFSIKFLSGTINSTLDVPQDLQNINDNQIDLKNYSLIEDKLNLKQVATTTVPTSTEDVLLATTTPIVYATTTVETIEIMPKIIINNSTLKAGLAGNLKDKLQAAGLNVLKTSTTKPTISSTIIKVKDSFNLNSTYLDKIKKIVSTDYDFTIQALSERSEHDIEIIIGNK